MHRNHVRLLCLFSLLSLITLGAGCGGGGGGDDEPKPLPINNPPSVSILQPDRNPYTLDVRTAQYLDITIKADDPDGGKLNCVWTWDAGSVSPSEQLVDAGTEMTARFTPPAYDGQCNLRVTVSESQISGPVSGTQSASANIIVTVTGHGVSPTGHLRIVSITATPDPVQPSQQTALSVVVENPSGNPLSYAWTTKHGTLSGDSPDEKWTAPSTPGAYGVYLTVSDGTSSVKSGRVITVAGPTGGLLGEYFKTIRDKNVVKLNHLAFSRIDPQINFLWERLSPDPSKLPAEGWGARWTGYIKCEQPGTYVFRVHADDGARMYIQNDNGGWVGVIPNNSTNWNDHTGGAWLPPTLEPIQLQGGKWYPVKLEFFQGATDAFISLHWSLNGGPETLVPQEDLMPPS